MSDPQKIPPIVEVPIANPVVARHNGISNGHFNNRRNFLGVTHVQALSNNPLANTLDGRILSKFQLNPFKKQSLNLSSSGDQHNREPIEDRGYPPAREQGDNHDLLSAHGYADRHLMRDSSSVF